MEIRDAIREERSTSVCLLNYRKDGAPFWNAFHMSPVRGEGGTVDFYIGVQADVTRHVGAPDASAAAALQAAVAHEAAEAERIGASVLAHRGELQLPRGPTCAACDTVASSLIVALSTVPDCFVLSDPHQPDTPMVYCSPAFLRLTGYSCGELVGHNCRMLQGPGTDPAAIEAMREALRATPPRPVTVTLLNYKKSGEAFYNSVHISPIRDADGEVQYFCGVQLDVQAAASAAAASAGEAAALDLSAAEEADAAAAGVEPPAPTMLQLLMQKGVVGAVRVAARSLSAHGLRRAPPDQHVPSQEGR
jgi:PAS domain S-box-containing protein